MVGESEHAARPKELRAMSDERVIVVHLRQPRRSDAGEMRSDPFYELGSFGCTRCHARNLMHPGKAHELQGVRFAFAQGGPLGFRLVHLTPPVSVVRHADRCEVVWTPVEAPFRYAAAPILVDREGRSDFPRLMIMLGEIDRPTWPARFSSAFRSRRKVLPPLAARELVRVFERRRAAAGPAARAACYSDALPYLPNLVDVNRAKTLETLRASASPRSRSVDAKDGSRDRTRAVGTRPNTTCSPRAKIR